MVHSTRINADAGLNYYSYDLSFSEKGLSNYRSDFKEELKEADNGVYYLPKGTYKVSISDGVTSAEGEFKIE